MPAQTVFTLIGSGEWTTPALWSPSGVPGASDTASVGVDRNVSVSSNLSVGVLQLAGGNVGGSATLTLTSAGSAWTVGGMLGTGTTVVASGATLALSGSANKSLYRGDGGSSGGRTLDNFGTITWSGTGQLLASDGAQVINRAGALFELQSNSTFGYGGGGSGPAFTNAGTLRKTAGGGTSTFSGTAFTTSGLVDVQSGTLSFTSGVTSNAGTFNAGAGSSLLFSGGQTFNTGTAFTGAGSILLNAGATVMNGAIASQNLTFVDGTLTGTSTVSGTLGWTGGSWSSTGTLTLAPGGTLAISGANNKVFNRGDGGSSGGRTIENFGTISWTGTGSLVGNDGAQIINRAGGIFSIQNSAPLAYGGGGSQPVFTNAGTLRKEVGTGTTPVSIPFVSSGLVEALTGTLAFSGGVTSNGGTFTAASGAAITFTGGQTFNDGTIFNATGAIQLLGGASMFTGDITASGLHFAGGDGYGTASFNGTYLWTDGTWRTSATYAFASGSTLTLSGSATKVLSRGDGGSSNGRVLQTAGLMQWLGAGDIAGYDGAGIRILGGGVFEIRNDSIYQHGGGGDRPFLRNFGTVRKLASAGTTTFAGVTFENLGLLDVQSGTIVFNGNGGLSNAGVVSISSGATLISSAAGGTSTEGTFDVASGGLLRFTGGTNTVNIASFAGAGQTEVDGGTLLVSSTDLSGNFRLISGTVGGAGTFAVGTGGVFRWSGGGLSGTGSLVVGATGQLLIDSAATKTFYRGDGGSSGGRTISNFGQVTWADTGDVLGNDGAQILNQAGATFTITGNAAFGYGGSGAPPVFINTGTVRKSAGEGTTDFSRTFQNDGLLEGNSGKIRISGGGAGSGQFKAAGGEIEFGASYTLGNGATLVGSSLIRHVAGTLNVGTGSTVGVGAGGLAGRLALENGAIGGGGVLLVDSLGRLDWSNGGLTGTGILRIASGGELRVIGGSDHNFVRGDGGSSGGRTIENSGTILWSGGSLLGGDGASVVNTSTGLLQISGGILLGYTGSGATPTLSNAGTVRKTAAGTTTIAQTAVTTSGAFEVQAGSLIFSSGVTSNGGTFQAAAGTTLTFEGGQTFNTGTTFTGGGLIQTSAGTTTLDGAISASKLKLVAGAVLGTATFTGLLEWAGAGLAGTGTLTIPLGSTLHAAGTGDRAFYRGDGGSSGGRTIENFGLFIVENAGNLVGGDGAQIINRSGGVLELRNDRTIGYTGSGSIPTLTNVGTLRKVTGTGVSVVSGTNVIQNGLVEVASGTLRFASGVTSNAGQFTVASGATLEFTSGQSFTAGSSLLGGGSSRITGGTTTLSGSLALADLEFAGGTLSGSGTLTSGVMRWTGGTFGGTGTLTVGSTASLKLTGSGDRTFNRGDGGSSGGRTIDNFGFLTVENTGNFLGNDGAQIVNRSSGVVQLRNDATIAHGGSGSNPTFTNQGTLLKTVGTGTSVIAVPFTNTGTIAVNSGTLSFTSTFNNSNGNVLLSGGNLALATPLNLGTATLGGSGTITAPNVTAGGLVSPGSSPGTLTVTGNLTLLSTSTLLIELGGTTQGSGYDFVAVGGTGALAGNLVLTFVSGFQSTVTDGNTFSVLNAAGGALTGAFTNVASGARLFTSDGLGSFKVSYGTGSSFSASSVVLSEFAPIPEPSTYALLGIGAAAVTWTCRRRRRP